MRTITEFDHIELVLHRDELLQLNDHGQGLAVECEQGVVWVTCTGDRNDYVLFANDRYVSDQSGKVVIEALREARVRLTEGNRHGQALRLVQGANN